MEHWENFSALHLATVAGFGALWLVFCLIGRHLRGSPALRAWRRLLGATVLLCWLVANGVQMLPEHFNAAVVLPLQFCDIAGCVAALAIWQPARLRSALLHFWGLGFSVQAILTPELLHGPAYVDFWTFWIPHANITGAAVYALAVDGYRPRWADARLAFYWALFYLAVLLPFDLLSGFNYGYVGPAKPDNASLIDFLGPWPWRVVVMTLLTALVFALLAVPWAGRAQKPRSEA